MVKPQRDLTQDLMDELTGWRTTPYPFWTEEQKAAALREQARHPDRYPLGVLLERMLTDQYFEYILYEGEEEPDELPPNTRLVVIPDHYLDPRIDEYYHSFCTTPEPEPEVWVQGRGALQTKGRLAYKKEMIEWHGATLEHRIAFQPYWLRPGYPQKTVGAELASLQPADVCSRLETTSDVQFVPHGRDAQPRSRSLD